jgi:hypothetical protein
MDDPSVILFDLDDMIVDFTWNQSASWRQACFEACPETGVDADELHVAITTTAERFWPDHDRAEEGRRNLSTPRRRSSPRCWRALG